MKNQNTARNRRPNRQTQRQNHIPSVQPPLAATPPLPYPLLTVNEVIGLLKVGRTTVFALIRRGELPCLKFGRALRFQPAALQRTMAARQSGGAQ